MKWEVLEWGGGEYGVVMIKIHCIHVWNVEKKIKTILKVVKNICYPCRGPGLGSLYLLDAP